MLSINDDLSAVRERARHEKRTAGEADDDGVTIRNGFVQRTGNGKLVTNEMVDQLRDELSIGAVRGATDAHVAPI